jgi:Protein of unknown function (DUF2877)
MTFEDNQNGERTDRATVPPPLWGRSTREARREGDLRIPILRSGVLAQQFCRSVARAKVEGVFARSLYLRHQDAFICIGEPAIGNGPLALIGDIGVSRLALQPGDAATVCERDITIGHSVRFTLDRSDVWRAPPWPAGAPSARLTEACAVLARRAASQAPEGFARHVLTRPGRDADETPLARAVRTRVAMFASWLSGLGDAGQAAVAPVQGLIGLGPGLTPSGDDFLVGALAALDAIGESDAHAALATAVANAAPGATSALSACFLRAAVAGHVGESLHRAVASLLTGDADTAVAAVANIGHSSGWDMMAGVATVLRIAAASRHDLAVS